jgi:hypothetical protein
VADGVAAHQVERLVDEARPFPFELVRQAACAEHDDAKTFWVRSDRASNGFAELVTPSR